MSIEVSNLDHLGLVAGIIDEIGIEQKINQLLGEQLPEKITGGQVVKGMVLNGLGLVSSPLYLFSRFFEGKAIEHLIGKGVKTEYFNDDKLGRVLDQLYGRGLNHIFMSVALEAVKIYELETSIVHLDSSSFHVHGDYQTLEDESTEDIEPKTIKITYGYSRDKRPDLKQFMMDLICTNDGDVPLWMRIGSGNESDQKQFVQAMKEFKNQLNFDSLMVADSALYQYENLQLLTDMKWLSRVPVRIKTAYKLVQEIDGSDLTPSQIKGYSYQELSKTYGGVQQRWLIVESQLRRESDLKNLEKKIQKERVEVDKKLRTLKSEKFACQPDAETAARKLFKKFLYHELTEINFQFVESKSDIDFPYEVQVKLGLRQSKIELEKNIGRFILATNVLDSMELTTEEMLSKYKGQQSVERGFRFLKDPLFLTDSVFLKSSHRIEALGLIMGSVFISLHFRPASTTSNFKPD